MTYELKEYMLGTGKDTGKQIYVVTLDGLQQFYTKPLTIEESLPLRRLVKDPCKMDEYINQQKGVNKK